MAREKVTGSGLPPSFPSQSTSAEYQMTEKNLLQWKQRVPLVEIRDKAGAAAQLFYVARVHREEQQCVHRHSSSRFIKLITDHAPLINCKRSKVNMTQAIKIAYAVMRQQYTIYSSFLHSSEHNHDDNNNYY